MHKTTLHYGLGDHQDEIRGNTSFGDKASYGKTNQVVKSDTDSHRGQETEEKKEIFV